MSHPSGTVDLYTELSTARPTGSGVSNPVETSSISIPSSRNLRLKLVVRSNVPPRVGGVVLNNQPQHSQEAGSPIVDLSSTQREGSRAPSAGGAEDPNLPTFGIEESIPSFESLRAQLTGGSEALLDPRMVKMSEQQKWRLRPLYKDSVRGSSMIWWVGFDLQTTELLLCHGYVNGAVRIDRTVVVPNQSGRSLHEQSVLEALQRYNLKFREGYRPIGAPAPEIEEPMLAAKWEPEKTRLDYPVGVQVKIDGIRCLCRKVGSTPIRYRSRGNREYPHFNAQFDAELENYFSFLPNAGVELDGEMYIHGIDFPQLSSVVRNERTPHPLLPKLIYHIFDFNTSDPLPYERRYETLTLSLQRYLEAGHIATRFLIVPTNFANSKDEIIELQQYYVQNGYEGAMIRKLANGVYEGKRLQSALYKSGRSNNLLKVKTFIDEECEIVAVEKAKGTEADAALLVVRDIRGNVFAVRPAASFEERRQWLTDPGLVINKKATIVYQELSIYNVPRFPVVKAIRDYE